MRHKCLASFIIFLLFFSVLSFIGFFQLRLVLTAKFTSNFLAKTNIYNSLAKIGEEMANSAEDSESKRTILSISQAIDPVWLKKQVDTNLPPFFDYMWGKTKKLNLVIDTSVVKAKIPADVQKGLTDMLKSVPECKPGQSPSQATDPNTPQCVDSATYRNLQTLSQLPDTINLGDYIKNPDQTFGRTKFTFALIKIGYWAGLILSLIWMGILALLGRKWWPSIPRWIGLGLVIPSGWALLNDLLARLILPPIQAQISGGLSPQASPIVKPIIYAIDGQTFIIGIILAGSIFLVGWILIIFSYILPHPPEPKPETKTVPAAPSSGGLTEAK